MSDHRTREEAQAKISLNVTRVEGSQFGHQLLLNSHIQSQEVSLGVSGCLSFLDAFVGKTQIPTKPLGISKVNQD
jgi:hypothetical protein